jgi:hypothetical protein
MMYCEPTSMSHDEAEHVFAQGTPSHITHTLISLAFLDPDVYWVEAKCLAFVTHGDSQIRAVAAICLGHLARIHQNIHVQRVLPVLIGLTKDTDPNVAGMAEDSLEDIELFMGYSRRDIVM